jgi:hypothetical protein
MIEQRFKRFNEYSRQHKRFVKPNDFGSHFNLKMRFIDEAAEIDAERDFKIKYAEEVKSAYEEVARQNKAANRKILIIASILMFLVWLILR